MSTSTPRALRDAETTAFLAEALRDRRRILEVGCGRGDVARALAAAGHDVTALDLELADPRPTPNVTYVASDFLAYDAAPFDAIAFTASLHHIAPLDRALDRAAALLAPGGALVIDDFDLEAPDADTLHWYYELQDLLVAAGLYPEDRVDPLPPDPADLLARWRAAHEHDHGPPLHTGTEIRRGVAERFAVRDLRTGEYLHRYINAGLSDDARGHQLAAHVLGVERRGVAAGRLIPVGLRIVADRL